MIRGSKQDKSRLVPLHATAVEHLAAYQQRRDQLCPRPATTAFFLSGAGTRLNSTTASKAFTRILKVAAITGATSATRPRLYDLRHYADDRVMRPARAVCVVRALPSVVSVRIIRVGWGQRPSESSQLIRDESRVQSGKASGVSGW